MYLHQLTCPPCIYGCSNPESKHHQTLVTSPVVEGLGALSQHSVIATFDHKWICQAWDNAPVLPEALAGSFLSLWGKHKWSGRTIRTDKYEKAVQARISAEDVRQCLSANGCCFWTYKVLLIRHLEEFQSGPCKDHGSFIWMTCGDGLEISWNLSCFWLIWYAIHIKGSLRKPIL